MTTTHDPTDPGDPGNWNPEDARTALRVFEHPLLAGEMNDDGTTPQGAARFRCRTAAERVAHRLAGSWQALGRGPGVRVAPFSIGGLGSPGGEAYGIHWHDPGNPNDAGAILGDPLHLDGGAES